MKKLLSLLLLLIFILSSASTAFAASTEETAAADALYKLGLFSGTGTDADDKPIYSLDRVMLRSEAITMLVRLLGKGEEAVNGTWSTPFTDVPTWAAPFVGYAYANGLTSGTGATTFGSNQKITASQYLTFVLRALGYEVGTDFQWNKAWELTDKIGLTNGEYSESSTEFTRGDAVKVSNAALSVCLKDSSEILKDKVLASYGYQLTDFAYPEIFIIEELPVNRPRTSEEEDAIADGTAESAPASDETETVLVGFTLSEELAAKRQEAVAKRKEIGEFKYKAVVTIPKIVDVVDDHALLGVKGVTDVKFANQDCEIDEWAFAAMNDLSSVTLPANLKDLSQGTFEGCEKLETVILPETVSVIGNYCFNECYSLTNANLPDGIETIGISAFLGCSKLIGITMPLSLKSIGNYAFSQCSEITELNFAEGLETIGEGAFCQCEGLTKITFPSTLRSIGSWAFKNCPGLTEIALPADCELGDDVFDDSCVITYY